MMKGRIRAALCLLAMNTHTGLLSLDEVISNDSGKTVRDVLEEKHPDSKPAHAETIVNQSDKVNVISILSSLKVSHQK